MSKKFSFSFGGPGVGTLPGQEFGSLAGGPPDILRQPSYGGEAAGGGKSGIAGLPGNVWDWAKSNPIDALAVSLAVLNTYGSYKDRQRARDMSEAYLKLGMAQHEFSRERWDEAAPLRENFGQSMQGFQNIRAPDLTETFADPSNPFYSPPSALGRHINGGSAVPPPTTSPLPPQEMVPGPTGTPIPAGSDLDRAQRDPESAFKAKGPWTRATETDAYQNWLRSVRERLGE